MNLYHIIILILLQNYVQSSITLNYLLVNDTNTKYVNNLIFNDTYIVSVTGNNNLILTFEFITDYTKNEAVYGFYYTTNIPDYFTKIIQQVMDKFNNLQQSYTSIQYKKFDPSKFQTKYKIYIAYTMMPVNEKCIIENSLRGLCEFYCLWSGNKIPLSFYTFPITQTMCDNINTFLNVDVKYFFHLFYDINNIEYYYSISKHYQNLNPSYFKNTFCAFFHNYIYRFINDLQLDMFDENLFNEDVFNKITILKDSNVKQPYFNPFLIFNQTTNNIFTFEGFDIITNEYKSYTYTTNVIIDKLCPKIILNNQIFGCEYLNNHHINKQFNVQIQNILECSTCNYKKTNETITFNNLLCQNDKYSNYQKCFINNIYNITNQIVQIYFLYNTNLYSQIYLFKNLNYTQDQIKLIYTYKSCNLILVNSEYIFCLMEIQILNHNIYASTIHYLIEKFKVRFEVTFDNFDESITPPMCYINSTCVNSFKFEVLLRALYNNIFKPSLPYITQQLLYDIIIEITQQNICLDYMKKIKESIINHQQVVLSSMKIMFLTDIEQYLICDNKQGVYDYLINKYINNEKIIYYTFPAQRFKREVVSINNDCLDKIIKKLNLVEIKLLQISINKVIAQLIKIDTNCKKLAYTVTSNIFAPNVYILKIDNKFYVNQEQTNNILFE